MSKTIVRKHSAKCLTLHNVVGYTGKIETLHFILVGGNWWFAGTDDISVSISAKDGFWNKPILEHIDGNPYSLRDIKEAFCRGQDKSTSVAMREWESNYTKREYDSRVRNNGLLPF